MSESLSLPATPRDTSNLPGNPIILAFDGFETLNTKPSRSAIEDTQAYICDGFMPFGKNNLRTMYGIGTSIYSAGGSLLVVMFWFGNIASTPYCLVFLSDGSIVAVNEATSAATTIAATGAIQNPSPTTIGVSQFGNEYFIIVSQQPNGYFLWDGSTFYKAGTLGPSVYISNDGSGYASPPSMTAVGGSGTGATFSATLSNGSIANIVVTNPGAGYAFYDVAFIAFSGGGGNTTAIGQAVLTGGAVTSINVIQGGTGYTSTTKVRILGGGGAGAVATATVSGGAVTGFTVSAGGESYQAPPTVIITDAANTVAVATVAIMPFGVKGTGVETYNNQVWVIDGSKCLFTAPESATDFAATDGGGAFPNYNSFLKIGFTGLRQSNGFLYVVADSSMNYISGVQTTTNSSTGAVTTTFSNQNVDPQIGSSWPGTLQVFSRNIVFSNSFGIHVSYGGAVTKVSDPLDGIYTTVSNFAGFSPSAAVAVIFGVHVYALLLPIIDQVTRQQVNKLILWDGKRFWTTNQEISLTWIATQEINSVMTAWGTDGTSIYPLFQAPSTGFTKTVQSKLFMQPSYFFLKEANRFASLIEYNGPTSNTVTITVDNGSSGTATPYSIVSPVLAWTNTSGQPITWNLVWYRTGLVTSVFALTQPGTLLGWTLQTTAPDLTVISTTLIAMNYQPLL